MQYTQEFEDWWVATYSSKFSKEEEFLYKQVACQAWRQQQAIIDELTRENESLINTADKLYYGLM